MAYQSPNTGETVSNKSFNYFGTTEGQIAFGDVMKNDTKMSVLISRIFPSKFKSAQYIGLVQNGKLDGSILNVAPSTYQVFCGESPVDNVAGYFYAENGDLILHAPSGRIRLIAKDIDIESTGNGTDTGWVNIRSNAAIDINSPRIQMEAQDSLAVGSERDVSVSVPGEYKISCGNFKVVETPDISPITSPLGTGSNTVKDTLEGFRKLIDSLRIGG